MAGQLHTGSFRIRLAKGKNLFVDLGIVLGFKSLQRRQVTEFAVS